MQETSRGIRFSVIDNFLSGADLAATRNLMERASFTEIKSVVAPLEDGPAFQSRGVHFGSEIADGRPSAYREIARVIGREHVLYGIPGTDWDRVTFTFWKYPAGSRLGWHNDAGRGRVGEFILFLHNSWRPSWGGELMLFDDDGGPTAEHDGAIDDPVLRMESLMDAIPANPLAIIPKPNRLVLVKAGTIHTIRRVDQTAGQEMRCTLTGFVSLRQPVQSGAAERLKELVKSLQP